MIEVLQGSQMWEGFLREREIWKKNDLLESCVLLKEAYNVWCVEDLSLVCCKCKNRFTENGHTKSGRYYCHPCFEQKFTIIDRSKLTCTFIMSLNSTELLNSSSTKMKKVGKNLSRRVRSVANDLQTVPSSLNKATSDSSLGDDAKKSKPEKSRKDFFTAPEGKSEGKFPYMKSSLGLGKSKKRERSVTVGKLQPTESSSSAPIVKAVDISNVSLRATQSFNPKTNPSEAKCIICDRVVADPDALRHENQVWHRNCAPCSRCLLPIASTCKVVDNKLYHPDCPPLRLLKPK